MSVPELAELLHETSLRHDAYEKTHAAHDWWDWYGAYMETRMRGGGEEAAVAAADAYMSGVLGVAAL